MIKYSSEALRLHGSQTTVMVLSLPVLSVSAGVEGADGAVDCKQPDIKDNEGKLYNIYKTITIDEYK